MNTHGRIKEVSGKDSVENKATKEIATQDGLEVKEPLVNEEQSNEVRFVKSRGGKNLGKIIVGNQQFTCNRQQGSTYYYDCARRHEGKGKAPGSSCKATTIIKTNEVGDDIQIIKMSKVSDHNHVCDMARVVKWLLYEQLEEEFLCDLEQKPSDVLKKVVARFKEQYQSQPQVWNEVAILTDDKHMDQNLGALKHRIKKQSTSDKSREHRTNTRIEFIKDSTIN